MRLELKLRTVFSALSVLCVFSWAGRAEEDQRTRKVSGFSSETSFDRALDRLSQAGSDEVVKITIQLENQAPADLLESVWESTNDRPWSADYARSENERIGTPFLQRWSNRIKVKK